MRSSRNRSGLTLVELAVVLTVLTIIAGVALPAVQMNVRRADELELKASLRTMRDAIDRCFRERDEISPGGIDALKYPKNLDQLVAEKYLRSIPRDPFTGTAEWRTISSTDDTESRESNEDNVWDVRSLSEEVGIDGTEVSQW